MKTISLYHLLKKIFLGIFTMMMIIPFESCTREARFLISAVEPAARGYVKVRIDRNKNYDIQVNISNLAEVRRLQPLKHTYVVWIVTDEDKTKNIGQINSTTTAFSKNLKASFETVSSFKPVKVFITAEEDSGVQNPGEPVVLSTDKF